MTKHTALGLFTLSLLACAGASRDAATTSLSASSSSSRDPKLAALDAMRAALEAKDARAVAALYADDAVVEQPGAKTLHGRAEIEAFLRASLAPAGDVRFAFSRVWLKGDVAIAEQVFRVATPGAPKAKAIGATSLDVMWFDGRGRITRERDYMNHATLADQMAGDPDAEPLPEIPATTEVHVARDGADDAKTIAWANGVEAANSRSVADTLATLDEHVTWDCSLGAHVKSRAALEKPLEHWRVGFPEQKWVATQVWPVEDFVVVEETFHGAHTGKFGGFAGTGRDVEWHWAEVWQVKDGRIGRGWSFADWDEVKPQLSGAPNPPADPHMPCAAEP